MVDSRIGADKAMMSFRDEYLIAADNAPRLIQDHLHGTRIFFEPRGDRESLWRRFDACQANEGAFSLGNNFLGDDEDVAILEAYGDSTRGAGHAFGKVITLANLRNTWNWQQQ